MNVNFLTRMHAKLHMCSLLEMAPRGGGGEEEMLQNCGSPGRPCRRVTFLFYILVTLNLDVKIKVNNIVNTVSHYVTITMLKKYFHDNKTLVKSTSAEYRDVTFCTRINIHVFISLSGISISA
jgi:hypothetical protein